jgi:hypothetical protein
MSPGTLRTAIAVVLGCAIMLVLIWLDCVR